MSIMGCWRLSGVKFAKQAYSASCSPHKGRLHCFGVTGEQN